MNTTLNQETTMTHDQAVAALRAMGMPQDIIEAAIRVKKAGQLHLVREAIAKQAMARGGYKGDQGKRRDAVFAALNAL